MVSFRLLEAVVWRCSVKKSVLKNFAKFTGKHLHQSLFFNKVAGLQTTASGLLNVFVLFIWLVRFTRPVKIGNIKSNKTKHHNKRR